MEKWGGMRKKVGEEGEGWGMRNGRGVDREMKVMQGVKNEGSTNRKNLHAVQKGECGENNGWDLSKKCPRRGEIQDGARKN